MSISKTPQQEVFPLQAIEQIEPHVERYSKLPDVEEFKARYLFGIPLTSALTGQTLADSTIEYYIKSAVSELEHILDLYITPVVFKEAHDYKRENFTWNYNYLKLNHSPILTVHKLELSFSNNQHHNGFVQFPMEFVYVEPQSGVVQLVPAFGTSLSGFLLSAFSGTQFHALRAIGMQDFPGGVRVTYTAGFPEHQIPFAISNLVGLIAAVNLMSILGPIIFPYNSVSVGIDGTSQSTSSMGPRFFNDRIAQLIAERDREMDAVKGYYQKRFLVDYL